MSSYIYRIYCVKNKHFYIGRTKNIKMRKSDHLKALRGGYHKNARLQNCYNKYGEESMLFEVITVVDSTEQVGVEQMYINACIDMEACMNINRSADTFCDVPWTEERKQKIRLSKIGKKMGPQTDAQKINTSKSLMGHVLSAETKQKISLANTGKRLSEEHKNKLQAAFSGEKNPRFGKTGGLNSQSLPVVQVCMDTLAIVNRFDCVAEVTRALGFDSSCVSKVCRGTLKRQYGFFWCYADRYDSSIQKFKEYQEYFRNQKYIVRGANKINARGVICVNASGEEEQSFDFVSDVSQYGYDPSAVVKVCTGKLKTHKGFVWKYK